MIDIIYGWLVIQVTENQFFSGALGAGVFTFLLYQIRSFPNKAWGVFKHQFTVMLTIKSDADFFGWVQEWLGALPYTKRARRIQLDGHYGNSEHVKWVVTLGEGQHFFWHRGRPIWLSYELIEPEGGSYNWHHRLTFYAFGRNNNVLVDIAREAEARASTDKDEVKVHAWMQGWENLGSRAKRSMNTIFLPKEMKEKLVEDLSCLPGPAPDGTLLTWILPFVPETIGNGQPRVRPARNYNHNNHIRKHVRGSGNGFPVHMRVSV